ncbi:MAG: ABC transporter ATP-binding protein [Alphaproteobacteria bacterium]
MWRSQPYLFPSEAGQAVEMADVDMGATVAAESPGRLGGHPGHVPTSQSRAQLREVWPHVREHRWTLGLIALVSLVAGGFVLAQPLVLQDLIDSVSVGDNIGPVIWLLIAITVGSAAFAALQSYLLNRTAERVVLGARRSLIGHLFRLPIVEFDRRRVGDLISRVGADTTLFRSVITAGLLDIVTSVLMFFGAVVLMAFIDPVLLGITLAAILIGTTVVLVLGMAMRRASRRAQEGVGDMTAAVERVLGAVRSVRAAGATEREIDRVGGEAEGVYRQSVKIARLNAFIQPVMSVCIQGAFVAVLGFGGYRVVSGALEIGELVAFLLYMFVLIMPLGSAIGAIATLQTGLAALDRMQEVLRLPLEADDETAISGSVRGKGSDVVLAFDNVDFSYDDGTPVLSGVSFEVRRGSRTAIVGPSGGGKSSILALIERFYDPSAGRIMFDGVDASTLRRSDLRRDVAYVEQEAPVLAGSLAANLRLGAPNATEAELLSVLADVGLGGLIDRSPEGLEMQVGDGGVLLSGGQRQRLAWARAFLTRAELFLLDEPTSSVDSRTEAGLQDALRRISRDRTVLVVAHRLATVADSDRIIVLDAGKVVATGTHDELLRSSPLYHELAQHQLLA